MRGGFRNGEVDKDIGVIDHLVDAVRQHHAQLAGTDQLVSTLDFTVSTTLGRRLYLRGYTAAGLTEDSPDYRFGIAVSARFDTR